MFQPAETGPHLSDKTLCLLFTRRLFYAAIVAALRLGDSNSQRDLLKRSRSTPQWANAHLRDGVKHPGGTRSVYPPAIPFPTTVTTKQPALTTQREGGQFTKQSNGVFHSATLAQTGHFASSPLLGVTALALLECASETMRSSVAKRVGNGIRHSITTLPGGTRHSRGNVLRFTQPYFAKKRDFITFWQKLRGTYSNVRSPCTPRLQQLPLPFLTRMRQKPAVKRLGFNLTQAVAQKHD